MSKANKDNIILIGMPGCGKSTVGVVLAKHMGYRFIDSDLLIQEREHRLLSEIIEQEGLDRFDQIEEEVNASIEAEHAVIATGGSVVYGPKAMEHLRNIGTVVYLKLSYEEIADRLGDLTARGVSVREGQTLRDLYDERIPLYEAEADYTFEPEEGDVQETVLDLAQRLSARMEADNGR